MRQGWNVGVWVLAIAVGVVAGWAIAGAPGLSADEDLVVASPTGPSPGVPVVPATREDSENASADVPTTEPAELVEPVEPVEPAEAESEPPPSPPPARPPGDTTVLVANGTGVAGVATRWSEELASEGFSVLPAVDGDPTPSTVVWFEPGWVAEAELVAGRLREGLTPVPLPVPAPLDPGGAGVIVLVGEELA